MSRKEYLAKARQSNDVVTLYCPRCKIITFHTKDDVCIRCNRKGGERR